MNVRMLSANAVFLMLPALLAACSDAPRPPAVSFRIQNVPPVPRTMASAVYHDSQHSQSQG